MSFDAETDEVMAPLLGKIRGNRWNVIYSIVFVLLNEGGRQMATDLVRAVEKIADGDTG